MDFVLRPFFINFRVFSHFWTSGQTSPGLVLDSKFCLVGWALFSARALENAGPGKKVPGSIPAATRLALDDDDDDDNDDCESKSWLRHNIRFREVIMMAS